jgi:hypothetical protein
MQKWEYMYILAYQNDVKSINEKQNNYEKNTLPAVLNQYGGQSWEAVSACAASEGANYWRIVLKRPLA